MGVTMEMEADTKLIPMNDYETWVGAFSIDCAAKMEKGEQTEWHCVSTDGELIIFIYKFGYLSFKYGATEYEALYGDDIYIVGSVGAEVSGLERKRQIIGLNKVQPRITISQILDFKMWDYRLGYV